METYITGEDTEELISHCKEFIENLSDKGLSLMKIRWIVEKGLPYTLKKAEAYTTVTIGEIGAPFP